MSQCITIAKFTLLEALRNRLLWLMLVIMVAGFGLTEFVGDIAIADQQQIQRVLLSSFLRYSGVVLIAIVVVSMSIRELQDKTLELILALNVSRANYYVGKLLGYSLLSLCVALCSAVLLLLYAPAYQVLMWSLSYFMELLIVASLALVMLFSFRQIPAALGAVLLIYALARSLPSIVLIAQGPLVVQQGLGQQFIEGFLGLLTWILPALDRFSPSAWLVYGDISAGDIYAPLIQTLIYLPFLSAVALVDFYRKNITT